MIVPNEVDVLPAQRSDMPTVVSEISLPRLRSVANASVR